jgi:hypothetical protein
LLGRWGVVLAQVGLLTSYIFQPLTLMVAADETW